jgi:hypothetical protein
VARRRAVLRPARLLDGMGGFRDAGHIQTNPSRGRTPENLHKADFRCGRL